MLIELVVTQRIDRSQTAGEGIAYPARYVVVNHPIGVPEDVLWHDLREFINNELPGARIAPQSKHVEVAKRVRAIEEAAHEIMKWIRSY